jgi:hypothetical protein
MFSLLDIDMIIMMIVIITIDITIDTIVIDATLKNVIGAGFLAKIVISEDVIITEDGGDK